MATTIQNLSSIFYMSGTALTQYWGEEKTARGWDDDDITFPDWPDLVTNPSDDCRMRYLGYGARTVLRWFDCLRENPGTTQAEKDAVQDCIDDVWDNFFLPGVDGCIVASS